LTSSAKGQDARPDDFNQAGGSPARETSAGCTPARHDVCYRALNPDPVCGDVPDTALFDLSSLINNAPVYNPSMLIILQSLLKKHEIILEYFPVDTTIYIIAITHEYTGIYITIPGVSFWQEAYDLLRKIRLAELTDFHAESMRISHVLLDPVADKLREKSRVIIVAHNLLNGFPFEILCFSPAMPLGQESQHYHYLVEGHQIVYSPSIPRWMSTRCMSKMKKEKTAQDRFLAFAGFSPGFEAHDGVQLLLDSESEVGSIGRLFEEKGMCPLVLIKENSNEHNFKIIAQCSHIIHLATHTLSDDEYPEMNGLLFWEFGTAPCPGAQDDGILEAHEICNLKIPAELIVLNSCASASIKSCHNMKWYSSADCFMTAGAKNILCTLWNVTDRFAQKFMVEFYRNYLNGMTFSQALQSVKIHMIGEPSTSLPINWATYVLIGE
jgi:CHAT domain-containing protein